METWIVAGNEIDIESAGTFEGRNITNVNLDLPIEVYTENLQDFLSELAVLIRKYSII